MTRIQQRKNEKKTWREKIAAEANLHAWFELAQKARTILNKYEDIIEGKNEAWNVIGAHGAEGASVTMIQREGGFGSLSMASQVLTMLQSIGLVFYKQVGRERRFLIDADACLKIEAFIDQASRMLMQYDVWKISSTGERLNACLIAVNALSSPLAFVCFTHLSQPFGKTVVELQAITGADQPEVSTAMKRLRQGEIVTVTVERNYRRYVSTFTEVHAFFEAVARDLLPATIWKETVRTNL